MCLSVSCTCTYRSPFQRQKWCIRRWTRRTGRPPLILPGPPSARSQCLLKMPAFSVPRELSEQTTSTLPYSTLYLYIVPNHMCPKLKVVNPNDFCIHMHIKFNKFIKMHTATMVLVSQKLNQLLFPCGISPPNPHSPPTPSTVLCTLFMMRLMPNS